MRWLIFAVVLIAILALAVLIVIRIRQPKEFILGEEIAKARQRDAVERKGPSPLPQRLYGARESSLVRPEEVPLDAEIREVVKRFAAADQGTRKKMRQALSTDEFYNLMMFARREAVFAMRDGKCDRIATGLSAVAMVDVDRIDYRDAGMAFCPLHYAARRCKVDFAPLLENAAAMSTREMREAMEGFAGQPESNKQLPECLLHDVGTGFIGRHLDRYEPTRDLTTAAVKLYDLFDADRYPGSNVNISDNFEDVWFPGAEDAHKRIRAGAVLHGQRDEPEGEDAQDLMVFLAEAANTADAEALRSTLRVSKGKAKLAVARGTLVVAVIAQPVLGDHRTVETDASLARFAEPIAKILEETR